MNKKLKKLIEKRELFLDNHDFGTYSITGIEKLLGNRVTSRLIKSFSGNDQYAIKWFYSPAPVLNGKTPNEYSNIDKFKVETIISRMYCGDNFA